mmetsp:Transcript_93656/g.270593  ORF Transcript_93656/g.270593 Transcript_93656/m.270593 type:complete len:220 (+) Transcript_93656:492-1151(+)
MSEWGCGRLQALGPPPWHLLADLSRHSGRLPPLGLPAISRRHGRVRRRRRLHPHVEGLHRRDRAHDPLGASRRRVGAGCVLGAAACRHRWRCQLQGLEHGGLVLLAKGRGPPRRHHELVRGLGGQSGVGRRRHLREGSPDVAHVGLGLQGGPDAVWLRGHGRQLGGELGQGHCSDRRLGCEGADVEHTGVPLHPCHTLRLRQGSLHYRRLRVAAGVMWL